MIRARQVTRTRKADRLTTHQIGHSRRDLAELPAPNQAACRTLWGSVAHQGAQTQVRRSLRSSEDGDGSRMIEITRITAWPLQLRGKSRRKVLSEPTYLVVEDLPFRGTSIEQPPRTVGVASVKGSSVEKCPFRSFIVVPMASNFK